MIRKSCLILIAAIILALGIADAGAAPRGSRYKSPSVSRTRYQKPRTTKYAKPAIPKYRRPTLPKR